jgi:lipopolysaccharide export system permease protein
MNLKKLDRLMVTDFIPPFIVTFFIALFVFVLQTLWVYIDDIAGKGVGFFLLVELVSYLSVSMGPMSLATAVLLSSVMVMGNFAERYELLSMKSSGISLWRIMRPLMVLAACIGVFSFFCSNYFIPVSNLKFKSRLYDIRRQKPALSLEESIFNDDFQGYSIRIGNKLPDNRSIEDVLLYDNRDANQSRLSSVAADSGYMYASPDNKFFVMHLYRGSQVMEPKPVIKAGRRNYPMMRSTFEEWTKVFDLDEFELDRTDEELFKSHHAMLSNRQLAIAIDSIDKEIKDRIEKSAFQIDRFFYFLEKAKQERLREERRQENLKNAAQSDADSSRMIRPRMLDTLAPSTPAVNSPQVKSLRNREVIVDNTATASKPQQTNPPQAATPPPPTPPETWGQIEDFNLATCKTIAEVFLPGRRDEYFEITKSTLRNLHDQAEHTFNSLASTRESRVKHVFEFYSKFSMAVACFIFLFIGAPMGAIVRKGGFGYPLLVSIAFFMLFIMVTIFSKNIAERFVIDAVLASWMNCLVTFPMGLALTYWAMRDTNLTQLIDLFKAPFVWIQKHVKIGKKSTQPTGT